MYTILFSLENNRLMCRRGNALFRVQHLNNIPGMHVEFSTGETLVQLTFYNDSCGYLQARGDDPATGLFVTVEIASALRAGTPICMVVIPPLRLV